MTDETRIKRRRRTLSHLASNGARRLTGRELEDLLWAVDTAEQAVKTDAALDEYHKWIEKHGGPN
jgi:hypothetical protein